MSEPTMAEMVMDAFRLARSGNYRTAAALKKAFIDMYPEASAEDRQKVFGKLAELVTK